MAAMKDGELQDEAKKSNLEINAGTKMRDAGIDLAKQLTPGLVPTRPKPLPFAGQPWPG